MKLANEWSIEGKDLISEVTCQEPYEWKELTAEEWEFSPAAIANARDSAYHVGPFPLHITLASARHTAGTIAWWRYLYGSH